jgi:hypothetical protein
VRRKTSGAFTWLCFSPYWNWNKICCEYGVEAALGMPWGNPCWPNLPRLGQVKALQDRL